jgi:hypothetical protein
MMPPPLAPPPLQAAASITNARLRRHIDVPYYCCRHTRHAMLLMLTQKAIDDAIFSAFAITLRRCRLRCCRQRAAAPDIDA